MSLKSDLDRQHPEYALRHDLWTRLGLLFSGGNDLRAHARDFLIQRPKEPQDIYAARVNRFTYQNLVGTIVSWYVSALWKKEISIDRSDKPAADTKDYYTDFLDNCDKNKRKFTDFWSSRIESALLYKRSFVLVDLPRIEGGVPGNLKEQMAAGAFDAYLVPYDPGEVINWSLDRFGILEWAVIKTIEKRQEFLKVPVTVTRWWYFDQTDYRVYEARKEDDGAAATANEDDLVALVDEGRHAMAEQNRVPLLCLELQDAHWLGHRMYLQALDHLNQDNSYSWALFMANLPLPLFKTLTEISGKAFSESNAVVLEPGDSFEYVEPSGVSFEHSAARVDQLREEIYRTCYLIQQGRTSKATPAAQSGYSKELDMMPSRDVLNAIGRVIREAMQETLQAVAAIRGDDIQFSVRGFNFEESDAEAELALSQQLQETDFPSDTVRRFQLKRAARALMADAPQDEKDAAMTEIEDSPTIDEQKQMQLEAQQLKIDRTLNTATRNITAAVAA